MGLNAVDWFLLLIVLLAIIRGCMRGLRAVLVEFVALMGGLFAAARLGPAVAEQLAVALPLPATSLRWLAFVATFGIACAGLLLIGRLLLAPRLRLPVPSLPGALAGLLAGLGRGITGGCAAAGTPAAAACYARGCRQPLRPAPGRAGATTGIHARPR